MTNQKSEVVYQRQYWSGNGHPPTLYYELVSARELDSDIIARLVGVGGKTSQERTYYVSISKKVRGAFALLLADPGTTWEFRYDSTDIPELSIGPAR